MKKYRQIKLEAEAILFDMDGVITNTMPYHFDAWKAILYELGIDVDCYDVYKREGQAGIQTIKELLGQHKRRFRLKEAKKALLRKERLFKKIVKPSFIDGSLEFVSFIRDKGFKLGLVTGTSRHEAKKILPKRIFDKFDAVVTGSEVKKGKPHPEPYLKCLKRLGVSGADAVVVENAPFGIESAKRAGIFCIAIETSLPKSYLQGADLVLKSIRDLKRRVDFRRIQ
jgi:beta-phosphoglucomutase